MSTQLSRNETAWWREADAKHHLHPFTDTKGLAQEGGSRIITKAEGVWLTDSEGNRILDGMAGLWCVNLGYGRKELAQAAYDQMLELPYYNTFFKTATPASVELSEKLAKITPEGLNHVFYGSSGSDANDTIVRMVRQAEQEDLHQPPERLSRQHHGGGKPRRHGGDARSGGPAPARLRARDAALLVRSGGRPHA